MTKDMVDRLADHCKTATGWVVSPLSELLAEDRKQAKQPFFFWKLYRTLVVLSVVNCFSRHLPSAASGIQLFEACYWPGLYF